MYRDIGHGQLLHPRQRGTSHRAAARISALEFFRQLLPGYARPATAEHKDAEFVRSISARTSLPLDGLLTANPARLGTSRLSASGPGSGLGESTFK